jgi:hypothetical protein
MKNITPVEKIALILAGVEKTRGFIHELEDVPKPMKLAAYYLGQELQEREVIQAVCADPSTEATAKLLLSNVGRVLENRRPNLQYRLEYVVAATSGVFMENVLSQSFGLAYYGAKPGEIEKEVEREPFEMDIMSQHLGIDPDLKLVADDVYPYVKTTEHRLDTVKNFDDLVMLAGSSIYFDNIADVQLQSKAKEIIESNNYAPQDLFNLVAVLYSQDVSKKIRQRNAIHIYPTSRTVLPIIMQVPIILQTECNPNYESVAGIAYDIDRDLGDERHRVLISPDGLWMDFHERFMEAVDKKDEKRLKELLINSGLTNDEELNAAFKVARNSGYRNISPPGSDCNRTKQFFEFVDRLPERILKAPYYDPNDKDFKPGDKVVPFRPHGIVRYKYSDADFTPFTLPVGTICEIVKATENVVTVKTNGKRTYDFDSSEIGKSLESDVPINELTLTALKLLLEPEVEMVRLKNMFTFSPDRYKDVLRYCISNLHQVGIPIEDIKRILSLNELGLIEYEGGGTELGEWLPGTRKIIETRGPLPGTPYERVREIFQRQPSLTKYKNIDVNSPEKSLCYLLMKDSNSGLVEGFLKRRNATKKYILTIQAIDHNNDPDKTFDPLKYHEGSLKDMLVECAIITYQSLVGVKGKTDHRGMSQSQYAHHTGDRLGELTALLKEAREREDISIKTTRGIPIIGQTALKREEKDPYDTPLCDIKYKPEILLQFELFQGLKEGIDYDQATKMYLELTKGYEYFVQQAQTVDDLRFIAASSTYGNVMKLPISQRKRIIEQNLKPHQLFLDHILRFIDKAMVKTQMAYLS